MNSKERDLRKNIGKKIKLARSKANYTQEELAEKVKRISGRVNVIVKNVVCLDDFFLSIAE